MRRQRRIQLEGCLPWDLFLALEAMNILFPKVVFLSFEEAREFARSLDLKNRNGWRKYCRSGKKPNNVPSNPLSIYKDKWEGWFNWLGTNSNLGGVDTRRLKLSFEDARQFAHNLGFTKVQHWREWVKSDKRPLEIPSDPPNAYRKQWRGWGNWLGDKTIRVHYKNRNIVSYEDARNYARNSKISTQAEWLDAYSKDMFPDNFPKLPQYVYKFKWKGWGDWLGTENNITRKEKFLIFEDAKEFVKGKFNKIVDWEKYKNSNEFPYFLPKTPDCTYKEKWVSWGDFLGTGYVAHQKRTYFTYDEAKKIVCNLGIESSAEWYDYWSKNQIPDKLPKTPWNVYKTVWIKKGGWGGFLGTGIVATIWREFILFEELKKLLKEKRINSQKDYKKFIKQNKGKINVPYHPEITYKDQWVDWYDFLGKKKKSA